MRRPVEPLTPPADRKPAPAQGRVLHLREPRSKSEKRLSDLVTKELKARNRTLKELIRCNRSLEKLEADLRKAGMVKEAPNGAGVPAPASRAGGASRPPPP